MHPVPLLLQRRGGCEYLSGGVTWGLTNFVAVWELNLLFFSETQEMFFQFNNSRVIFIYLNFITQIFQTCINTLLLSAITVKLCFYGGGNGDVFLLPFFFLFKANYVVVVKVVLLRNALNPVTKADPGSLLY